MHTLVAFELDFFYGWDRFTDQWPLTEQEHFTGERLRPGAHSDELKFFCLVLCMGKKAFFGGAKNDFVSSFEGQHIAHLMSRSAFLLHKVHSFCP